jgi:hypothetical protein
VMACGGLAELFLGVRSEQRSLEDIATPLTAEEATQGQGEEREPARRQPTAPRRERFRPGPGRTVGWPGMPQPASRTVPSHDREVDQIVRVLRERGATGRGELGRAVGARQWGPGRYGDSLRAAQRQGLARRVARARYEAADRQDDVPPAPAGGQRAASRSARQEPGPRRAR